MTTELRELVNKLKSFANRLAKEDASQLVCQDRRGLIYNTRLPQPKSPSISNTAAFLRLRNLYPTAAPNITDEEVKSWTGLVVADLHEKEQELNKDIGYEQKLEAAYKLAHSCWSLNLKAENEFSDWVSEYCKSWLLRKHPRIPTMYMLHLSSSVLDDPSGNVRSLIAGVAEDVVWRQLAACSHSNPIDFDPIELSIGLTLCASAIPNRDFRLACQKLNDATSKSGTWVVRPHTVLPSCSSLYAVVACIGCNSISEDETLLDSIVAHAKWLLNSASRHGTWLGSDLTHRIGGAEPWFNFLAIDFAFRIAEWLSGRLQSDLLRAYSARFKFDKVVKWRDLLLDDDARLALSKAFIEPIKTKGPGVSLSRCTAILFGPPGTAKTTIAEALASEVEWPLIEIGVSDFLAQGINSVFAQSKTIFDHLLSLSRVIVLLDEVEGVFANRDDKEAETFQKLLTSSLLPYLKRLRDRASIILLIATNHINRFDAAVQRPGRIDLIIPVGPPSKESRKKLLKAMGINGAILDQAADSTDKATIGELEPVKDFVSTAKNNFAEFTSAWNLARGSRRLITDEQLKEFQSAAEIFKRLN